MPAATTASMIAQVLARRRVGLGEAARRSRRDSRASAAAARLDRARGRDRLVDGFAGDEPAREARRLAHAVARGERLQRIGSGRAGERRPWTRCRASRRSVRRARASRAGARSSARSTGARCARARGSARARGRRCRAFRAARRPRRRPGVPLVTPRLARLRRQLLDQPVDPRFEIAPRDRRPHRRGEDRRRQHLVQRADARADEPRQLEHVAARLRVAVARRRSARRR